MVGKTKKIITPEMEIELNLKTKIFKKNEFIIKKGEYTNHIFIIKKGKVELSKKAGEAFAKLGAGDIIGSVDFISEKYSHYFVKALEETEVDVVNPRIFGLIYDNDKSGVIRPILQNLAEKLRFYERLLEDCDKLLYYTRNETTNNVMIKLQAETKKAKEILNNLDFVRIEKLPFYVGRFSRRRTDLLFHKNDLSLLETPPYSISRSHFVIRKNKEGYFFIDRGSKLGALVNNEEIGGRENKSKILLKKGENEIVFGNKSHQSIFKLIILEKK